MSHKLSYEEPILVGNMTRHMAGLFQEFTLAGGVRPFGVSILLAGVDHLGCKLYQLDPSGVYHEWKAVAIGKNSEQIKKILERRYKPDMDLDEAIHIGLNALKEKFEGVMSSKSIEIVYISNSQKKFHQMSKEQVQNAIDFLKE